MSKAKRRRVAGALLAPALACVALTILSPLSALASDLGMDVAALDAVNAQLRRLSYSSFRDLPGITEAEIKAIEAALASRDGFVFGMTEGADCFTASDGSLDGFGPMIANWLSDVFGVPFTPFVSNISGLHDSLASGEVQIAIDYEAYDLAQDVPASFVTSPLAERKLKLVLDASKASILTAGAYGTGDGAPGTIPGANPGANPGALQTSAEDMPATGSALNGHYENASQQPSQSRYSVGYMRGSSEDDPSLDFALRGEIDKVFFETGSEAAEALRTGKIDAFVCGSRAALQFGIDPGMLVLDFPSPAYQTVRITTRDPAIAPIIDAIDKCILAGALSHLDQLSEESAARLKSKLLFDSLNEAERSRLREITDSGGKVPVIVSASTYPIGFYDDVSGTFAGISVDILNEIGAMAGIDFVVANSPSMDWHRLLDMFDSGAAPILSDFSRTPQREGGYLWADEPYAVDSYVLVTGSGFRKLTPNSVYGTRVGLVRDTGYAETFRNQFPGHGYTIEFNNRVDAFAALDAGDVDAVMLTDTQFHSTMGYYGRHDFRVNMTLDATLEYLFGFTLGQDELRGIVSKAQRLVDVQEIGADWEFRAFDYKDSQASAQFTGMFYICVGLVAALCALISVLTYWHRQRRALHSLVAKRTKQLSDQTKALERASESKRAYLKDVSHDMRESINTIIGLSDQALCAQWYADDARSALARDSIGRIRSAGASLIGVANALLEVAKPDISTTDLLPATYDLPSMIHDAVSLCALLLGDKPVEFRLALDDSLPTALCGDATRIRQVFDALLREAANCASKGFVEWRLTCERIESGTGAGESHNADESEDVWLVASVTLSAQDSGDAGVPAQTYGSADSFFGLAGVDDWRTYVTILSEAMDGKFEESSDPHGERTLVARIRQKLVSSAQRSIDKAVVERLYALSRNNLDRYLRESAEPAANPAFASILAVDDMPESLSVIVSQLRRHARRVDALSSGRAAVAAIKRGEPKYGAVLIDMAMPEMDGQETVRRIRAIGSDYAKSVPVIGMTSAAADPPGIDGTHAPVFTAYLDKPVDERKLSELLSLFAHNSVPESEAKPQGGQLEPTG